MSESSTEFSENLGRIRARLDDLLHLRYADAPDTRRRLADQYLHYELEALESGAGVDIDWPAMEGRALYFACQDLIPQLVRRYCFDPSDVLMREEMALYVIEQLGRDDMRRMRAYDDSKGASFRTYLKRVVANLATDFLRRFQRENEVIDRHQADDDDIDSRTPADEPPAGGGDMETLVAGILAQPLDEAADPDDLHQCLRRHLNLNVRERLLLKAIYFDDLSAEEAGQLPGMEMNKNQANSLHRRLLERLADAFRRAGVYGELQSLVGELAETLAVSVRGVNARVSLKRIILLQNRARNASQCTFQSGDRARHADVAQDYAALRKLMFELMLDIRGDAMAAEAYMQAYDSRKKRLTLRLVDEPQPVQPRYTKRLREKFATQ